MQDFCGFFTWWLPRKAPTRSVAQHADQIPNTKMGPVLCRCISRLRIAIISFHGPWLELQVCSASHTFAENGTEVLQIWSDYRCVFETRLRVRRQQSCHSCIIQFPCSVLPKIYKGWIGLIWTEKPWSGREQATTSTTQQTTWQGIINLKCSPWTTY